TPTPSALPPPTTDKIPHSPPPPPPPPPPPAPAPPPPPSHTRQPGAAFFCRFYAACHKIC
ncbi:hypothetical protein WOC75_20950, partial [Klebsiella pneumoniae]|uniref:hypothetical protein n=1 Tax=Klebsiella pneumoniae TaxID=573 RepID=UPI0030F19261